MTATTRRSAPRLALLLAVLGSLGACGDDDGTGPPPLPPTGSVEVTTATAGESIDADGYSVTVAGGADQAIGTDATLTVDDVEVGSRSVELGGVAPNCVVSGDNPRTVNVTDGDVAATAFAVTCTGVGSVEITTSTTGEALDADGYLVSVAGGPAAPIGLIEALTVESVPAGSRSVDLTGVAANCAVAGDNPRDVSVPVDGTASTQFNISCVAPISDQIVFTTNRNGNSEVYVMNEDGSNPINLTDDPAEDRHPSVSSDGSRIAFVTDRDGNFEIYVMNADGTDPVNLTNDNAADRRPAWSPDGTQILFTSNRSGVDEIHVMNADGSGVTNLSNMPGTPNLDAAWSPDGTRIAFGTAHTGVLDIYVMNADGSGQTNLTNEPSSHERYPTWSPDGTQILFRSSRDGDQEVYVMNADGSAPVNLTNQAGSDSHPTWSPDGTQILFETDREGNTEIYVMNADGSGQTNLTNNPASGDTPGYPQPWR